MTASGDNLHRIRSEVRRFLCPIAVLSVCFNITLLTIPIYMLQVYDRVLTSGNATTLLMLTMVAVGLVTAGAALHYYRAQTVLRLGVYVQQQLSLPVFAATLRRRFTDRDGSWFGALDEIAEFISGPGLVGLFDIPWAVLFIGCIYVLHVWLGVAATVAALILVVVGLLEERREAGRSLEAVRQQAAADRFLNHSLSHSDVVGAMGMGHAIGQHWRKRRQAAAHVRVQAAEHRSRSSAIKTVIRQLAQMTMLGLGAYLAIHDLVSAGAIIAASIVCSRALAHADQALPIWRGFRTALEAYRSLSLAIGDSAPRSGGASMPWHYAISGALRVEGASVSLSSPQTAALEEITFSLNSGESLGVIGPSAAAKSTLAKVLVGELPPATGRVLLDGVDLSLMDDGNRGSCIGYVPQRPPVFDGSIAENIARFGELQWEAMVHAAQLSGVHDAILALPEGYETEIEARRGSLPLDLVRGIALARALYRDPMLIVVDEVDAQLDERSHQAILHMIQSCRERRQTLIMMSDRPSIVRGLDWFALLVDGRFEGMARPDRLVAEMGLLKGPRAKPAAASAS